MLGETYIQCSMCLEANVLVAWPRTEMHQGLLCVILG